MAGINVFDYLSGNVQNMNNADPNKKKKSVDPNAPMGDAAQFAKRKAENDAANAAAKAKTAEIMRKRKADEDAAAAVSKKNNGY